MERVYGIFDHPANTNIDSTIWSTYLGSPKSNSTEKHGKDNVNHLPADILNKNTYQK